MKTTYNQICVNDWVKLSDSIYQVIGRWETEGMIRLRLDRERFNGEDLTIGEPDSKIERLTFNQVANIGQMLKELHEH